MNTKWILDTHGDPLGTVRDLVMEIWGAFDLDAMIGPLNGRSLETGPQIMGDMKEIGSLNPFVPLMPINAAKLVPQLINDDQNKKSAAILRPCEMRTLIEMCKQNGLDIADVLTISIDCLGTLPMDEYQWRVERKGSTKRLTQEALQFSRQGGILRYRYRSACQVCISPEATTADINIGILGLPVRQHMIISTKDEAIAQKLNLMPLSEKQEHRELLAGHQRVTARLVQNSENTRERIAHGLAELLPENVEALIEQLESCGDCTTCLDTCPLCDMNYPRREEGGKYVQEDIMRWLISCSGCGICEQACPQHLPLTIIFNHIQTQLAEVYNYQAGFSIDDSLRIFG